MKLSLIDMVQDILSDMDSDEVSSLGDTAESMQVAQIIKTTYYEIIANRNWSHLKKLLKLTEFGDENFPTHLKVSDEIKEFSYLFYDVRKSYLERKSFKELKYLTPHTFLLKLNSRNSLADNVQIVSDNVDLLIYNDRPPEYYTSFDDKTIILDSFNKNIENTIHANKIQAAAYIIPAWSHEDSFIPDLPTEAFPMFLAEAKSAAFLALKQEANQKAEQQAARQRRWLSQKNWTVADAPTFPNYGRTPRK